MTRVCIHCHAEKPLDNEFPRNRNSPLGRRSVCRVCLRKQQNAWRHENIEARRERSRRQREAHPERARASYHRALAKARKRNLAIVAEYRAQPCTDCGQHYPASVMQFDHVHGEKLGNVMGLANTACTEKRLRAEIEKCEIRCANCHLIRHHDERQARARVKQAARRKVR